MEIIGVELLGLEFPAAGDVVAVGLLRHVAVLADHQPQPDSFTRAWRWLSNGYDVVQGHCLVRNGAESWVARLIAVEFEAIYAVAHPGRARLHDFGVFGGSNGYWQADLLRRLIALFQSVAPEMSTVIKWGQPTFELNGPFAYVKPAKAHVTVGFWRGIELADPTGLLGEGERMRHFKLTAPEQLDEAVVRGLVQQAVASTQVRTPSGEWFRLGDGDAARLAKAVERLAEEKLTADTMR